MFKNILTFQKFSEEYDDKGQFNLGVDLFSYKYGCLHAAHILNLVLMFLFELI